LSNVFQNNLSFTRETTQREETEPEPYQTSPIVLSKYFLENLVDPIVMKLFYKITWLIHVSLLVFTNKIHRLIHNQLVRLLVSARTYQPANSIFLSQQTSTSRPYQSRNQPNRLNVYSDFCLINQSYVASLL